jgi:hypothetical protein
MLFSATNPAPKQQSTVPSFPDIEKKGFLVQQKNYQHNLTRTRTVASLLFLDVVESEDEFDGIRPSTSKTTLYSQSRPTTRGQTSLLNSKTRVNTAKTNQLRPMLSPNVSRPGTHRTTLNNRRPTTALRPNRSPPSVEASLLNLAGIFPLKNETMTSNPIDMLLSTPRLINGSSGLDISRNRIASPAPSLEDGGGVEKIGEDRSLVFLHMKPITDGDSGGMRMLDRLVGKVCTPGYIVGMCSRLFVRFKVDHATVSFS